MQKILVVGGAGYIGSHMVKYLSKTGFFPIILDNLIQGKAESAKYGQLFIGELNDKLLLEKIFQTNDILAVMHFASFIQVGESISYPAKYYENNVCNTITLLNVMARHQIKNFIFSSTAAIFGDPKYLPLDERHPMSPINPYGKSKWLIEQMLEDYENAYGIKSICLRYFNAAGADPDGELGECHEPETHLIPLLMQVALGRKPSIIINGDDYDTADGTCIRDYIHVQDICAAHLLALKSLLLNGRSARYNLGNGSGYSVAEVISVTEKITEIKINKIIGPRREGDPSILVADSSLIKIDLNWRPEFPHLEKIIQHAWNWEKSIAV